MKLKVVSLALACLIAPTLFAQSSESSAPVSRFVVWQVASSALGELAQDEQALVRLQVVGRQVTSETKSEVAWRIRDALQQLGYFRVKVSDSQLVPLDPTHPERVELRVAVDLGARYHFSELNWKGVTALTPGQLSLLTPMKAGDVFNIERVRLLLDTVRRMYAAFGNTQVTVVPDTEINDSSRTVAVTLDVSEHL